MNNYFHIALNVQDLGRSIRFYRILFDLPPDKVAQRYSRFTLHDPPLVVGLNESTCVNTGNRVAHFGLRLASSEDLETTRARLAEAGLIRKEEHLTTCCYAVLNKIWVRDPDGNDWEVYELVEDLQPSAGQTVSSHPEATPCCATA